MDDALQKPVAVHLAYGMPEVDALEICVALVRQRLAKITIEVSY